MAFNKVVLCLGGRGTGKTSYVVGDEQHEIPNMFDIYIKKGMKVLIVDTIPHPAYAHIPFITKDRLPRWKKGVYRILIDPYEINEFCLFLNTTPAMLNTFIVWEDAKKHTFLKVPREMGRLIIDTKQKNIDMLYMYHTWMQAPDELYGMIDYIECFKVKQDPQRREKAMPGYYEEAYETWERVLNHASRFHHETIDTGNNA